MESAAQRAVRVLTWKLPVYMAFRTGGSAGVSALLEGCGDRFTPQEVHKTVAEHPALSLSIFRGIVEARVLQHSTPLASRLSTLGTSPM